MHLFPTKTLKMPTIHEVHSISKPRKVRLSQTIMHTKPLYLKHGRTIAGG